ncbi:4087_t:CDS:10 [Diversispora eburnea]|uniref:4087_t:CDS:1 n=1 Tax=Diversispora eburnea TaxID=1213867 RepID=A0A9N9F375_9GLOM|nr:4087_t:CDS:10 [Diversispora eburnea]
MSATFEQPVVPPSEESLDSLSLPSAQLQKAHEEFEQINNVTEVESSSSTNTYNTEGAIMKSVSYDTDFPSLSVAGTATKSSSVVWGTRSGAELVRSDIPIIDNRTSKLPTTHAAVTAVTAVKKSGIITERLELPASQQLQKKEFGNKTTTADIVKRVRDKTNTHIDVSTGQKTGITTFLIKGKIEDVMRAKRELLENLAVKSEVTIQVPVSARRFILGSRGQTLQGITLKTGTRIQLPPRQENSAEEKTEFDNDEDEIMVVKIEGDVKGVNEAKAEIEAIVNERSTKRNHRITHIEHQFYPLIAGAHNQRINQIAEETGIKIHVPPYIATVENNESNTKDYITLIGERDSVKTAADKIEAIYVDLKNNTRTLSYDIPKRQHRFLIGPKGVHLHELLESTECSLELSPSSNTIVIRGPQSKHPIALQSVLERVDIVSLDVTLIHRSAEQPLEHAKNILKYLVNRSKLRKIETDFNVQIIVPKGHELENEVFLDFISKVSEDAEKAKNEPPNNFTIATIEPHLHRHIIGRKGQNLQRVKETYGVEIIVPDEKDENPVILIVYEGKIGEEIPTDKKLKDSHIKEVLEKVKVELIKAAQDASDFATQTLSIPVKFHRHIIGPKGSTLNNITGGMDAPVSVKFGSYRTGAAERSANAEGKKLTQAPISNDIVIIKGPTEEVERVVREINKVVEESKHAEIMNSYTIDFNFPAQYSAHIIGKGGAHVTMLKENLGVRIDIEGGRNEEKKTTPGENVKVTITGMKENVEEAKAKILDLIDKLQDSATECLKIPSEYHKSLIGTRGRYVKRLEEKYGVHIRFPRTRDSVEESEEDVDAQKPDEVIIKGRKKGVNDAKAELMDLLDYEKDHGNSVKFTVPSKYLPHIVGRNGTRITDIKDETMTRIDIGKPEFSEEDGQEQQVVSVVIQGTKDDINNAKNKILNIVSEFEKQTTITMNIDPQYHKYLIGPGGSRIREIVAKAGGPDEKSGQAGIVKFPRQGFNSDEVILKGDKDLVGKVKAEIERLVEEQSNLQVDVIRIPRSQHHIIIGRAGFQLREIQNRFNVEIQFPGSRSYNDFHPTTTNVGEEIENIEEAVKIAGKADDIKAAKNEIHEILSKVYSHVINIPRKYHKILISNGINFRKLRNEFHVTVDYDDGVDWHTTEETKESVVAVEESVVAVNGIDNEGNSGKPKWQVIKNNDDTADEGEIAWNLKGEKSQVERAEKYLNEILDEERTYTHTSSITVPQQYHRHIIGRSGQTITRIRNESKCRIEVPKAQNDETVIITGSEKGIDIAQTMIKEVIERAG